MSKNNFNKVFKFTIAQLVKGKSFKVATIVILALVFIGTSLINIIPALTGKSHEDSSSKEEKEMTIKSIYYKDTSDLNVDLTETIKVAFPKVDFKISTEDDEKLIDEVSKTTEEGKIYIKTCIENNVYTVKSYEPPKEGLVSKSDIEKVTSIITSTLNTGRLIKEGVAPENVAKVTSPIDSITIVAGEKEKTFEQRIAQMVLPMVACLILFYIIYFYGYWVANSIVAEKTSRVMELLLTSVKPLELITGKCVAMGTLAIAQFSAIIVTALVSYELSGVLVKKFIDSAAKTVDLSLVFSAVDPIDIVWIVLFFILGYVLYAIFNALVGSTISKLEDLNMAMMPVSFLSLIGFYLSYMALTVPGTTMAKVATFLPFSAPFYIPAAVISSDIPVATIGISLAILIVSIVLLILFTSKVYSVVILHTGNRLKFKDLFEIFKEEK